MPEAENASAEYRRQADRARRLAGKASDGVSRRNLLDEADKYEELANQCDSDAADVRASAHHPSF